MKLAGEAENENSTSIRRGAAVGVKDARGGNDTGGAGDAGGEGDAGAAGAVGWIELRLRCGRCVLVRPGFCQRPLLELVELLEANRAAAREPAR